MTRVIFIERDGTRREVESRPSDRLLDVAQNAGEPLEGTCEGQMACSTWHVIVDADDFARLPRAVEDEEDMLDLAAGATRYSRLSCQIWLDTIDAITVRIPPEAKNMQGR